VNTDLGLLEWLGGMLDCPVIWDGEPETGGEQQLTVQDELIQGLLRIRTKTGKMHFKLNRSQSEYARRCTRRNIVLKARQVGITTYIAARFFIRTITRRGTLSVQVAHDRESAEEIFRIVKRFWDRLPISIREGPLRTSYCNARQLVFPGLDSEYCVTAADDNAGRGWTIQNLHCSEVARWGRGGEEALASLRAAVVPGGEIVLESTPNGAGGLFYEEWQRAPESGYTRHFFPWWFEPSYKKRRGRTFAPFTVEEQALMLQHGLTPDQIAWRRMQWQSLRALAAQEFSEDPVSCFRSSGECVFDQEAVERAWKGSSDPVEMRDNHRLLIWLPAQVGRDYVMGVDPAGGGTDGDYSCAQMIDRRLGTQCAELLGHYPL